MEAFFPIFLRSDKVRCLVIGAGKIAARKTKALLQSGIKPVVIAPEAGEEMVELIQKSELKWHKRVFVSNDLIGFNMVIAATSSLEVNHLVEEHIGENVLFNNISDMNNSNFIVPAVVERGGVKIAVSSNGQAPLLTKEISLFIENMLPDFSNEDVQQIAAKREEIISTSGNEWQKKIRLEDDLKPMIRKLFKKQVK